VADHPDRHPKSDRDSPRRKTEMRYPTRASELVHRRLRARPLLCTIHRVTQLHASTRAGEIPYASCLTWDIRDSSCTAGAVHRLTIHLDTFMARAAVEPFALDARIHAPSGLRCCDAAYILIERPRGWRYQHERDGDRDSRRRTTTPLIRTSGSGNTPQSSRPRDDPSASTPEAPQWISKIWHAGRGTECAGSKAVVIIGGRMCRCRRATHRRIPREREGQQWTMS
jgi:hypothetical protein